MPKKLPPVAATALLLAALLTLVLSACTARGQATAPLEGWTAVPGAEATLTAWPTPPPIVTIPPTTTPNPEPVWTAPVATAATSSPPPEPASAGAGAPRGTLPSPVRLQIPALDLDVPVAEVGWNVVQVNGRWQSVWQTADGTAGHHRNSANPGEAGNVVISGHHNTRGEVLRALSEAGLPGHALKIGDEVVVVAKDGRTYSYRVDEWVRLDEDGATEGEIREHAEYLEPTMDARLTLITCWPYESNTHRVVVLASLIP